MVQSDVLDQQQLGRYELSNFPENRVPSNVQWREVRVAGESPGPTPGLCYKVGVCLDTNQYYVQNLRG